ncbi:MAG: hypothetical protein QG633_170 [Patescibacteria group bacterium]|nr:hypothetical protein [Patescibacteria group bacterium]
MVFKNTLENEGVFVYDNRKGPGRNAPGPRPLTGVLHVNRSSSGDGRPAVVLRLGGGGRLVVSGVDLVQATTEPGGVVLRRHDVVGHLRTHRAGHCHDGVDVAFGLHDQHAPESRRALLVVGELRRGLREGIALDQEDRQLQVVGNDLLCQERAVGVLLELEDGELHVRSGDDGSGCDGQNGEYGSHHQQANPRLHSFSPVVSDAFVSDERLASTGYDSTFRDVPKEKVKSVGDKKSGEERRGLSVSSGTGLDATPPRRRVNGPNPHIFFGNEKTPAGTSRDVLRTDVGVVSPGPIGPRGTRVCGLEALAPVRKEGSNVPSCRFLRRSGAQCTDLGGRRHGRCLRAGGQVLRWRFHAVSPFSGLKLWIDKELFPYLGTFGRSVRPRLRILPI